MATGKYYLTKKKKKKQKQKQKQKLESYFGVLNSLCGAKRFGDPGSFHIKLMSHVEEDGMPEDKQRMSKLSGYTAEDNPYLR